MGKKRLILLGAVTLTSILIVVGIYMLSQPTKLDTAIKQAPFITYKPTSLPSGYVVDQYSGVYNKGVLTFVIMNPEGQRIVVTEQQKPDSIDMSAFSGEQVTTNLGKAIMSLGNQGSSAAVITNANTLVLLNSTTQVSKNDMLILLAALKN